jgi:hypothetical protein
MNAIYCDYTSVSYFLKQEINRNWFVENSPLSLDSEENTFN